MCVKSVSKAFYYIIFYYSCKITWNDCCLQRRSNGPVLKLDFKFRTGYSPLLAGLVGINAFLKGILCVHRPRVANCREITAGSTLWSFFFLLPIPLKQFMWRMITIYFIYVQWFLSNNYNEWKTMSQETAHFSMIWNNTCKRILGLQ